MLVAERFIIASLINKFGKCPVSTDGGGTWYPQAVSFWTKNIIIIIIIISIPHLRKVSLLKEQSNISKIELKDLMITFHVERKIASLSMCNNG
jgi:hypothetical protein